MSGSPVGCILTSGLRVAPPTQRALLAIASGTLGVSLRRKGLLDQESLANGLQAYLLYIEDQQRYLQFC